MKEGYSIVSSSKLPRVAIHEREENEGGGLIWTAEEYRIVRQRHKSSARSWGRCPGTDNKTPRELAGVVERGGNARAGDERMGESDTTTKEKKERGGRRRERKTTTTTCKRRDDDARQMERDQAKMRALKASKRSRWGGAKEAETNDDDDDEKEERRSHDDDDDDAKKKRRGYRLGTGFWGSPARLCCR